MKIFLSAQILEVISVQLQVPIILYKKITNASKKHTRARYTIVAVCNTQVNAQLSIAVYKSTHARTPTVSAHPLIGNSTKSWTAGIERF